MPPKAKRGASKDAKSGKPQKKVKTQVDYSMWEDIAAWLRIDSIRSTNVTKTGHPTSCASIADIMSILFFHPEGLKFDPKNPSAFLNDRIVLSKGHAAPILYSCFYRSGIITQQQLMSLRLKGSLIQGHPVPSIPFVDVATGSLGQGLSVAAGMAYSSKNFDKINNRMYCICGDGEVAEGSIWQAANFSSIYKLNNLTLIVDINRLGQSRNTALDHNINIYHERFSSFGWKVIEIDGHNMHEIVEALVQAKKSVDAPVAILAKTFKGKGLGENIENQLNWHGKALSQLDEGVINSIKEKIKHDNVQYKTNPTEGISQQKQTGTISIKPQYQLGFKISTRKAYGNGLKHARQSNSNVVALDCDTSNSTFSETLKKAFPESFIECFIADQNQIGVATGLGCRKKIPFASSFAAFFSRAADQIRICGISNSNVKFVGSHSGCSIGEDGPSQMALEDIAIFRAINHCAVLVPSDGYSIEKAVQVAGNYKGPAYIRTSRPDVEVIYNSDTVFELGKSITVKKSQTDQLLIASFGVTLHEALKAYKSLVQQGINVRILDVFSLKPIDKQGIKAAIQACHGKVLVVEQHYPQGALAQAICHYFVESIKKFRHLCVKKTPGSATGQQQLQIHGLDSNAIFEKVKQMLAQ